MRSSNKEGGPMGVGTGIILCA